MSAIRQCDLCGSNSTAASCCGVPLGVPFRMTKNRVVALRAYAHGRKGLDIPTYKLHLAAVGVESTLHLTRETYDALLRRLRPLPDRPRSNSRMARA